MKEFYSYQENVQSTLPKVPLRKAWKKRLNSTLGYWPAFIGAAIVGYILYQGADKIFDCLFEHNQGRAPPSVQSLVRPSRLEEVIGRNMDQHSEFYKPEDLQIIAIKTDYEADNNADIHGIGHFNFLIIVCLLMYI